MTGCISECEVEVFEDLTEPECDAGLDKTLTCAVTEVTLDGSSDVEGATYSWTGPGGFTSDEQSPEVSVAGTYELTVTHPVTGCISECEVEVFEETVTPTCDAGDAKVLSCQEGSTTVILEGASQTQGVSFSWSTNDGMIESGANTATPTVSQPGTYTLRVTVTETGCYSECSVDVTEDTEDPVFANCNENSQNDSPIDLGCNPEDLPDEDMAINDVGEPSDDHDLGNNNPSASGGEIIENGCERMQIWTVSIEDACGNIGTCEVTYVWVEDEENPVFANCTEGSQDESPIDLGCNPERPGEERAIADVGVPSDNCGVVASTLTAQGGTITGDACGYTQVWTVSIEDACGNIGTCEVTYVWVEDEEDPVFANCMEGSQDESPIDLGCNPGRPDAERAIADVGVPSDNCGVVASTLSAEGGAITGDACGYTQVWTVSIEDACGNIGTCEVTYVWVEDEENPVFTNCTEGSQDESPIDLGCNPERPDAERAIADVGAPSDNCGVVASTLSAEGGVITGDACGYTQVWTVSIEDACGNVGTCEVAYVWVEDEENPVFANCPIEEPIDLGCNPERPDAARAIADVGAPSDNCGVVASTLSAQGGTITGDACGYTQVWTVSIEDECENVGTCEVTYVWVEDEENPVFANCTEGSQDESPIDLGCNPERPDAERAIEDVGAPSDNCGVVESTLSAQGGVITGGPCGYLQTWTVSIEDACGNVGTCEVIYTWIEDEEAPQIVIDAKKIINCDDGAIFDRPDIRDNCDNSPDVDVKTEYFIPGEGCRHRRTWTVTDHCGNVSVASQIIIIDDNTPPVLEPVHPLLTGLEDGDTLFFECSKPVYFSEDDFKVANECKNCPQDYDIKIHDYAKNHNCENGTNAVREVVCWWTATDEFGNESSYTIYMFAMDRMPPEFVYVPGDKTIGEGDPVVFGQPRVEDACSDQVNITYVDSTFQVHGGTEIKRTWTATDNCGNFSQASQSIVIEGSELVFTGIPQDKVLPFGSEPSFDEPEINPENSGFTLQIVGEDLIEGDTCAGIIYKRTWRASNGQGVSATTSQKVEIEGDDEKPVILNPPSNDLVLPCNSDIPEYELEVTDNSGGPVDISVETTISKGNCEDRMGIRNWTVTDACGNLTVFSQMIYFNMEETVSFTSVPKDTTIAIGNSLPQENAQAETSCEEGNLDVSSFIDTLATTACQTILQKIWIATDACGDRDTAYQEITFEDSEAPVFEDTLTRLEINCGELDSISMPVVSDNVGLDSLMYEDEYTADSCAGNILRKWTAVDRCGNSSHFLQEIRVRPDSSDLKLVFSPADTSIRCGDSIPSGIPLWESTYCHDLNIDESISYSIVDTNNCGQGLGYFIIKTWTVTNSCGFTDTTRQHIAVLAPGQENLIAFLDRPIAMVANCLGEIPYEEPLVKSTCDSIDVFFYEDTVGMKCSNNYRLLRTWIATDTCGQVASTSQTIQIRPDTEAPVISVVMDTIELSVEEYEAWNDADSNVDVYDNCGIDTSYWEFGQQGSDGEDVYFYTYSVTDYCGNTTKDTFYIVLDGISLKTTLSRSGTRVYPGIKGGVRPFTFHWEYILSGQSDWEQSEQALEYFETRGMGPLEKVRLRLTDNLGNSSAASINLNEVRTRKFNYRVYPNPADNFVEIELEPGNGRSTLLIQVYDMVGNQIYKQEMLNGERTVRINSSNWPSGSYFIKLIDDSTINSHKLIIAK